MGGILFLVLAAVVIVAGLASRRKIRNVAENREPIVTEDLLREILEQGEVEGTDDGPLDEDAIREAEDEFWEEDWDDPEPWAG